LALKSRDVEKKEEKGIDSHFHGNDRGRRMRFPLSRESHKRSRNDIRGCGNTKEECPS